MAAQRLAGVVSGHPAGSGICNRDSVDPELRSGHVLFSPQTGNLLHHWSTQSAGNLLAVVLAGALYCLLGHSLVELC